MLLMKLAALSLGVAHTVGSTPVNLDSVVRTQELQTPGSKKLDEVKRIEEITAGYEKAPGLLTVYRKKQGNSDSILLEISKSALDSSLLLQATISSGTLETPVPWQPGRPVADMALRIELINESKLVLKQPSLSLRAQSAPEMAIAIKRGVPDTIIATFDIKAYDPKSETYLIDVSNFLKSDYVNIRERFSGGSTGAYSIDQANSYVDSIKALPQNIVVRSVYRLNWSGAEYEGRYDAGNRRKSVDFAVTYNWSQLPKDGYMPRLADTRVGYFTTHFMDFGNPTTINNTVNYIHRWRLEKRDSSADISEPKNPIVFWLDNAIPTKYRQALREGLEMWNPVFEREVGIRNAIVVKQREDDADWDISDVRYNVLRWTVRVPFAEALSRVNPYTGEILGASINFDSSFLWNSEASSYFLNPTLSMPAVISSNDSDCNRCSYQSLMQPQRAYGLFAISALQKNAVAEREKMIMQELRAVAAHEMGHVLGLRHNFKGSTGRTVAQLSDPKIANSIGLSASIMDYLPFNVFALKQSGVDYYTRTTGEYDSWAIRYGYKSLDTSTPEAEVVTLKKWASRSGERGLAFQPDEMVNAWDPFAYAFDLANDPLQWLEKEITLSRYLLLNPELHQPPVGESYYHTTVAYYHFRNKFRNSLVGLSRFIGGLEVSNNFRGDINEKPTLRPVDFQVQKRALDTIIKFIFNPKTYDMFQAYQGRLVPNPSAPTTHVPANGRIFNIYEENSEVTDDIFAWLFESSRIKRLMNSQLVSKRQLNEFTLSNYYRRISDGVWNNPLLEVSGQLLGRDLQRNHIRYLTGQLINRPRMLPSEAISLAYNELKRISAILQRGKQQTKDQTILFHLQECEMRINRALAAGPGVNGG